MLAVQSSFPRALQIASVVLLFAVFALIAPQSALAQSRAALVRDTDNPDLAPGFFTAQINGSSAFYTTVKLATVPAGKRYVVDTISFSSAAVSGDQLVYVPLFVGQTTEVRLVLPINAPHPSVTPGYTVQNGQFSGKAYFEAGEEIWIGASHTSASYNFVNVYLTGHYVTP